MVGDVDEALEEFVFPAPCEPEREVVVHPDGPDDDSDESSGASSHDELSVSSQSDNDDVIADVDGPLALEDVDPQEALLVRLGLTMTADREIVHVATGRILGQMSWLVMNSLYLRVVCRMHDNCRCFIVAVNNATPKALRAIQWLEGGRCMTRDQHVQAVVDLKAEFGIYSRGGRRS